ncbi:MAG: cellulose biosynthesis cyclic di-GMP-binding regulatory protein BcsB [Leptolyngbyaceae cyanobacterium CRU_2_3]|nr:cellulose biosynthesis cyclic di-GMP-binding regulatory protein BcsB [Leptolyngbyaceae cyanobacterium CRU_2_3]
MVLLSCSISLGWGNLSWESLGWGMASVQAQSSNGSPSSPNPQPQSSQGNQSFTLPNPLPAVPVLAAAETGQYVLEFNRSPLVGNRLRLESIYDEARLRFTRPRNWTPKTVKLSLRYRHSPALYASRSNLTVLINGTSIGSVPLNQPEAKIGNAVFNVPPNLIQDFNEVTIAALQNNSPTCTQDPYDPSLWTEVMPDSKLVFNFQPQPIPMNFSRYPYPIFDTLSLEANQIAYFQPKALDESWLTATARLQAALGADGSLSGYGNSHGDQPQSDQAQ